MTNNTVTNIVTGNNNPVIFQIGTMGNIPSGEDFSLKGTVFCVYNISGDNIEDVEITLASGSVVTTTIEPGWNPMLITKITSAPEGLQYGY